MSPDKQLRYSVPSCDLELMNRRSDKQDKLGIVAIGVKRIKQALNHAVLAFGAPFGWNQRAHEGGCRWGNI